MAQSIYSHQYDNGLILVAEPITSLESVAFTFLTPSGCRFESRDRQGLAAMTCDMVLRGAGDRDSRKFLQDLEILGVERGESVTNAHMSFSGATLSSNLFPALEIYADLLRRPQMPSDQIEAARMVVLQELHAIEDEPGQKVMLDLRRRQYPDPLGRSSQGTQEGIEAITHQEIAQFYQQHSVPSGTILGVAGRFEWEPLKEKVGELLADWSSVERPSITEAPPLERIAHIEHDSNQTQIGISYDSVPYCHPDYFQASGAVGVLSGGMSSRLFTEVREKRGLCYSVYATIHTLQDRGCVLCYAGTSAERAQETLDVTIGELQRLSQGVEESELNRLKARIKSGLIMQQESSSARSSSLARDWYHLGHARTLEEVGQIVDVLSCESINAYLAAHPPENFAIVTLGPSPLEVPVGVSSS